MNKVIYIYFYGTILMTIVDVYKLIFKLLENETIQFNIII